MEFNKNTIPDELVQRLIEKAKLEYGEITVCAYRKSFTESVTIHKGEATLWFNAEKSTHMVKEKL
jgi:hypothetical protein